ncbi:FRG domain-containing protein [Aquicella lusitana]|uniref:FRG domain-containing protein n=1 Tax=Aquicella lusitana TaxID=254246 RepID=A0A370G9D1_9COXI|nr:FRG domain-containing protein [Aquicella lusitana]RDI39074.1 FRG domain-containing protein [Aquicella lusitana]VVC73681.1 hypothetical protein AQULUS_14280 [Aquicella lusitana]
MSNQKCGMLVTDAKSVSEFLNILNKRNERWRKNSTKRNYWVYRGQWEPTSLSLLPSSLRNNLGLETDRIKTEILQEVLPNGGNLESFAKNIANGYSTKSITLFNSALRQFSSDEIDRLKEILKQSVIELLLIKKFIDSCNKSALYLQSNEIKIKLNQSENNFITDEIIYFLDRALERWLKDCLDMEAMYRVKTYPPLIEYQDYYSLALSQHSGVPTRLLDWTYSSYIAAFFSAYQSVVKGGNEGNMCVYAFNTLYQNDVLIHRNSLRLHQNLKHNKFEFLHMQKGLFTEMRGADFYYFKHGEWPSLEEHINFYDEYVDDREHLYNLEKISLPASFANELLDELALEDITKATLMPTYFHCADSILKR